MFKTSAPLMLSACLGLMTPLPTQAAERWFLMSRHGDCAEVGTLRRKVPDIGEINDPQAFATFMRGKGHAVAATQISVPKGSAWEVKVPEKELFLMFVTAEMCSRSGAR